MAGGMHGGNTWQGDMHGRGHAWQGDVCGRGACMAGAYVVGVCMAGGHA